MKHMKNILITLSALFVLGCSGGGGGDSTAAVVEVETPTHIDFNNSTVIVPRAVIPFEGGDFDITFIPTKDKNLVLEENAIQITKSIDGYVVDSEWANIFKDVVHDVYQIEGTIHYDYNPLDTNITSRIDAIYYINGETILFQSVEVTQLGNLIEAPTITANYEDFTVVTDSNGNITITENGPNDFTINSITADDYVNLAESLTMIPVSGTSKIDASISFVINGNTYNTQANNVGVWSVDVNGTDLSLFDNFNVTAVGVDEFGITYTESSISRHLIKVITNASVVINDITDDNNVTIAEASSSIDFTGLVTGDLEEGDAIAISLGGNTYNSTVSIGGLWSVSIDGNTVINNNSTTVTVTGVDEAGNPVVITESKAYDTE